MPKIRTSPNRVLAFRAVPIRARSDGWTPLRQAQFMGHLAQTRCVRAAALAVGMSRETAYRLRAREGAESFCAAWDGALGGHRVQAVPKPAGSLTDDLAKVTLEELMRRFESGVWQVIMRRGKFHDLRWKPCNSAFFTAASRVGMLDRTPVWTRHK